MLLLAHRYKYGWKHGVDPLEAPPYYNREIVEYHCTGSGVEPGSDDVKPESHWTGVRPPREALLERSAEAARLGRGHGWLAGSTSKIGKRIIAEVTRYEEPQIVETGAGASTLLFCCLEPHALTSIAPDSGLHERMLAAAREREILRRPSGVPERAVGARPTQSSSLWVGGSTWG